MDVTAAAVGSFPRTIKRWQWWFLLALLSLSVGMNYFVVHKLSITIQSAVHARDETSSSSSQITPEQRPCSVAIENTADGHYELIESTILRYPLPWSQLNCSTKNTVVFDVALFEHSGVYTGEKSGWERYFRQRLQHQNATRIDGIQARFGELVHYTNYSKIYDAIIGVSCDSSTTFQRWLRLSLRRYCILHQTCRTCKSDIIQRTCMLNPMHPRCFFLPIDLPQFQERQPPSPLARVCVSGSVRNHAMLAEALATLQPRSVRFFIHDRLLEGVHPLEFYKARNVSHLIEMVREKDFLTFQKSMSMCHVLLPLIDPVYNPAYFFHGRHRKLTGAVPQAIAYKIPTVSHVELEAIYHNYWTAPVQVYNDTASFILALEQMMASVIVQ